MRSFSLSLSVFVCVCVHVCMYCISCTPPLQGMKKRSGQFKKEHQEELDAVLRVCLSVAC